MTHFLRHLWFWSEIFEPRFQVKENSKGLSDKLYTFLTPILQWCHNHTHHFQKVLKVFTVAGWNSQSLIFWGIKECRKTLTQYLDTCGLGRKQSRYPNFSSPPTPFLNYFHTTAVEITAKILSLSWRNFFCWKNLKSSKIKVKIQNHPNFNADISTLISWATLAISLACRDYAYTQFTQAVHLH